MNKSISKAWRQYEAGLEYKHRIGLFDTVRRNERYYRGEQWEGEDSELPRPVFNIIRRIVDYLVCSVASGNTSICFSDENLPLLSDPETAAKLRDAVSALSANTSYRWEHAHMDSVTYQLLYDAAISGDGVIYCWWDTSRATGQDYTGDISTRLIDNVDLFVSDVNRPDLQSQDYIILSGRDSVLSLRAEARRAGRSEDEISRIVGDDAGDVGAGDLSRYELEAPDCEKATFIIKFWRENGRVVFEKSTRDAVIRRAHTAQLLYPVAYFNWLPTKNSFHGTSPISTLIPNQRFVNRAFAMVMKHMTDTAFSKVLYDKTRIPEWSNEIGEAIAVSGGTTVSDAVEVVGVGRLESGYTQLIELASDMTRELCGLTETAVGEGNATNTSAILALQEAARIPLEQVRRSYFQCLEDLANIWADMMCAYYTDERLVPLADGRAQRVSFALLRQALLRARVEVGETGRYSSSGTLSMLNRLLDSRCITPEQYIERLPAGLIADRRELLEQVRGASETSDTSSAAAEEVKR